jgi:hypothetical protein
MPYLLVVPIVCPLSGDVIDVPPEDFARLEACTSAHPEVIELVCDGCGAGGRLERSQYVNMVSADEVRTEDTTRLSWSLTQMSTSNVTTVK